jgi:hypothetical protein
MAGVTGSKYNVALQMIFLPGLAILGTAPVKESAPVELFRGRQVDPNSIFCKGHYKIIMPKHG